MSRAHKISWIGILALTLTAMLLWGCTASGAETLPVPETVFTEPTVQTTEPAKLVLVPGPGVTVDGVLLESGSVIHMGTLYVKAEEFFRAQDGAEFTACSSDGCTVRLENQIHEFQSGSYAAASAGTEWRLSAPALEHLDTLWLPVEDLCGNLQISLLRDEESNHLYCTSGILGWDYPKGIHIPVLMYHAVNDNIWGLEDLFVSPEVMETHLKYLTENGYDLILFEDLKNADQYDKPVILTFDDGYLDNYTELYPLLEQYGAKATIFVVTSSIGNRETSMTPEQVKLLSDSPLVSIQSHTVSHSVLRRLDSQQQAYEMEQSRLEVTRMTGRQPFAISYPTGAYNDFTLEAAMEYYRFAVTVTSGTYITGDDPFTILRYNVRHSTTLEELAQMVTDAGETES